MNFTIFYDTGKNNNKLNVALILVEQRTRIKNKSCKPRNKSILTASIGFQMHNSMFCRLKRHVSPSQIVNA